MTHKPWYMEEKDTRIYPEASILYLIWQAVALVYPMVYDGVQMFKGKGEYFQNPLNYIDMLNIIMGYLNILF